MKKHITLISLICLALLPIRLLATNNYAATNHGDKYPTYPSIDYSKYSKQKANLIKRGEYLTKLGDCIACHTNTNDKPFAGGRKIKTPFGTIYTPNITSDKKTGIGNWSLKDFITAMRDGKSPQGQYYYPAFPYIYFNILPTKDLEAIKAYLDTIPAIQQKNKGNDLSFPFSWRFLQLGWRMLFFHNTGPYKNNPKQSPQWNRGKFLVDGLGHCSMCHTPMHHFISKKWVLGAPIKKYYLTGAMVEGFFAPNITSTNLKDTPIQQIADVFLKDKLIGGGQVQGPMDEANHDSLKYLHPDDIKAIAIYLKTVKSEIPPKINVGTGLAAGKKIYERYCAACHSTGAGGAPIVGKVADWTTRSKLGMNTLYKNAINGIGGMPAKGTCKSCTTQEIQDAVQYMMSESKSGAAVVSTKPTTKPLKKLTLADGKKIYETHCASCHNGSDANVPALGDKQAWSPIIKKGLDVLIYNTIRGYKKMPVKGSCTKCNDAQIKAAVKYMVNQSKTGGDYHLW